MTSEQVWAWWDMAGTVIASLSPVIVFVLALGVVMFIGRATIGFIVGLSRRNEGGQGSSRDRDRG